MIEKPKSEYQELRDRHPQFFKPRGSDIQQTVPSEPIKAFQIEEEQIVRIENALLHPFKSLQNIEILLSHHSELIDALQKDNLMKRNKHDDWASLGATLNYRLVYHNHLYVYCYSNTGFTLQVSNGATQVIPANYWSLVNYPEGVQFTVSGGSDTAPILVSFRSCDVPLTPAVPQTSISGTVTVSGTVNANQTGTWTVGSTNEYPVGATPIAGTSGNVSNAVATATLTGSAGFFTWCTGFEITGAGATAALPVSVTLTNTVGGTLTYTYAAAAGVLVENTPLLVQFSKAVRSFSTGQNMVLSVPALGAGNTNSTAVIHGYTL